MSYLVLARKHRPQTFDDVVGQEHITQLLKSAIESDRVAHSYLFCGPRGIGKTSCARILAMCLNAEGGPSVKPSLKSSISQEIAKGTSFDVIEIDGASNRGIDEIRTLRENVKFSPTVATYKIYIVDEVHMLTSEAFNALLKTLEEPPEHVKFIFATTDPNKVPATIISRCQRFDFKRISMKTIVEHLTTIVKKEKLTAEPDSLYAIAKASQGSLRDALSILDQLSAVGDRKITTEDVTSMLGVVETQLLFELTQAIGEKNCARSLEMLENMIDKGKDIKQLGKDIIDHFRNMMIIKVGGKGLGKLVDYPSAIKEMYLKQCEIFSLKDILNTIDAFIQAQETARITESLRMPLEIAIAKLTYTNETTVKAPVVQKKTAVNLEKVIETKSISKIIEAEQPPEEEKQELDEAAKDIDSGGDLTKENVGKLWDTLTTAVSKEKMSTATYLQDGKPIALAGAVLTVGFPHTSRFSKETLEEQDNLRLVERIFTEKLKTSISVKYVIIENYVPQAEEESIKEALDTFGGTVVNRWHRDD